MHEYDLIVWGATGYTGRRVCDYILDKKYPSDEGLKWAVSGRNNSKLEALVATLRMKFSMERAIDYIVPTTQEDKVAMAARTRCIVALAGPYTECGEEILRACVQSKTHYVDITGELDWVKKMTKKYQEEAARNKVAIIPCCGFDFLPNDIMVNLLTMKLGRSRPNSISVIHGFDTSTRNISGGTMESAVCMFRSKSIVENFRTIFDSYTTCDDGKSLNLPTNSKLLWPRKASNFYCAPFIMTPLMAKYVFWRQQAQGYPLGYSFTYFGGLETKSYLTAVIMAISNLCIVILMVLISRSSKLAKWVNNRSESINRFFSRYDSSSPIH